MQVLSVAENSLMPPLIAIGWLTASVTLEAIRWRQALGGDAAVIPPRQRHQHDKFIAADARRKIGAAQNLAA